MSFETRHQDCFHCGSSCATDAIHSDGHVFCCHGCLSVYELIRSHDACTYYEVERHPGHRPDEQPNLNFDGYERMGTHHDVDARMDRQTIVLHLPDMHCASCVWLLERLSRFDAAIVSSRVDLVARSLTVSFHPAGTSASRIALLLTSLGYPPSIAPDGRQHDAKRTARRQLYTKLGIAGFAAGNVMMIGLAKYVAGPKGLSSDVALTLSIIELALSIPVLLFCAQPWLRSAWGSLQRRVVNLDVPVALGILTIFVRSIVDIILLRGEGFLDSFTGLVFFLLIGRLFQQRAFEALEFERSMRSFFPISATLLRQGQQKDVAIEDLTATDTILVRNGEVIPADAILLRSAAVVDYAYLTGESEPIECLPGAMLLAGGRVLGRSAELSVVTPSSTSYMASLWSRQDIHTQRQSLDWTSERFGLLFTIGVLCIASAAALAWLPNVGMSVTVFSSVLIIACPCALTLSMPITFGTAMTMLASKGFFLKNVAALGELNRVTHIVFDKTGTLTSPLDVEYVGETLDPAVRRAVSTMARHSTHPFSQAIAGIECVAEESIQDVHEIPGKGLTCKLGDRHLAIGSMDFAAKPGSDASNDTGPSGAHVFVDGRALGKFVVRHALRNGVPAMVNRLRNRAYALSVVSGDGIESGWVLTDVVASDELHLAATPQQKVDFIIDQQHRSAHVMMVGDGLNDIAAMSAANVSVAVSNGSSRIVPACDVMVDAEHIRLIDRLLEYAMLQHRVVRVAFWFTMAYNALGLTLACTGLLSPVITAIMMPISSLLVIAISVIGARLTFRSITWE